jgi:hypothetical protein
MDEGYFDEKKGLALDSIRAAITQANDAALSVKASRYALPDLTSAEHVHELLKSAALRLTVARRDFEKARWATANTDVEFEDWLRQHGCVELVLG